MYLGFFLLYLDDIKPILPQRKVNGYRLRNNFVHVELARFSERKQMFAVAKPSACDAVPIHKEM